MVRQMPWSARRPSHQRVVAFVGLIPAARRHRIVQEVLQLSREQWVAVTPAMWARAVAPDIVQLIRLDAWKGASYSFAWGVSLGFVPHRWDSGVAWHRTLKSSRMDLRELAPNVAERAAGDRPHAGSRGSVVSVANTTFAMMSSVHGTGRVLVPHFGTKARRL
jgi:hypothetical protein